MDQTYRDFFSGHDPAWLDAWRQATVGIAGAGGLGSNAALALTRAGIGKLVIADFDLVTTANLNRQQYFLSQVGMPKVDALKDNLSSISPFTELKVHQLRIAPANLEFVFGEVDILIEAFDLAEQKEMLIENWQALHPDRYIIAASGLAGVGGNELIRTERSDTLFIIGDGESELAPGISPISPRVAVVANMQANLCLSLLLEKLK